MRFEIIREEIPNTLTQIITQNNWRGPKTNVLRKLINAVLPTDSELEAFCLDYFPAVHENFTNGMDRIAKVSILFIYTRNGNTILDILRQAHKERVANFQYILSQGVSDFEPDPHIMTSPVRKTRVEFQIHWTVVLIISAAIILIFYCFRH